MSLANKLGLAASAVLMSGLVSLPAHAATAQHCPMPEGSVKVETDGASNSVSTGLEPGTEVCVKAGTQTTIVTVGEGGIITQTALTNKNGKALGISYYVYSPVEEPPCDDSSCPGPGGS